MLCDSDQFSHEMKKLDIRNTDEVVVYDTNIMIGGCRSYWALRVFGVNVSVMDSPLSKWIQEGKPIETTDRKPKRSDVPASDEVY